MLGGKNDSMLFNEKKLLQGNAKYKLCSTDKIGDFIDEITINFTKKKIKMFLHDDLLGLCQDWVKGMLDGKEEDLKINQFTEKNKFVKGITLKNLKLDKYTLKFSSHHDPVCHNLVFSFESFELQKITH